VSERRSAAPDDAQVGTAERRAEADCSSPAHSGAGCCERHPARMRCPKLARQHETVPDAGGHGCAPAEADVEQHCAGLAGRKSPRRRRLALPKAEYHALDRPASVGGHYGAPGGGVANLQTVQPDSCARSVCQEKLVDEVAPLVRCHDRCRAGDHLGTQYLPTASPHAGCQNPAAYGRRGSSGYEGPPALASGVPVGSRRRRNGQGAEEGKHDPCTALEVIFTPSSSYLPGVEMGARYSIYV